MKSVFPAIGLLLALVVPIPPSGQKFFWGEAPVCAAPAPSATVHPPEPRPGSVLRVLSWNLHGAPSAGPMDARLGRIAAEILRRRPDLVLVQELWFADDAHRLADELADAYLRLVDGPEVTDRLLYRLTGLRRGGLLALVARDSAWRPAGPARFERFRAAPPWWRSPLEQGDGLAEKGVQTFTLVGAGVRIGIANTHLQARYAGSGAALRQDARIRERQVEQLLRDLAPAPDLALQLLFGDFNLYPGEAPYRRITRDWLDLTRGLQCPGCATRLGRSGGPGGWVDYVFARPAAGMPPDPHLGMITNRSPDCPYSDHHGLELQLSIAAPRAGAAAGAVPDPHPPAHALR